MKGVTDKPRLVCAKDNGVRDSEGCLDKPPYYELVQFEQITASRRLHARTDSPSP